MNLQEFVSQTLKQIIDGVRDAQAHASEAGATVNPSGARHTAKNTARMFDYDVNREVEQVQFDVALTATAGTETKGGIGVFVGAVALGSQGASRAGDETVSRVKFNVPIILPGQRARL